MYKDKLIALFNKALRDEYTAVLIYDKMSGFLKGIKGSEIAKELIAHSAEEHAHAQKISNFMSIHGLEGGVVFTIDQDRVSNSPEDLDGIIEETQDLETEAAELYSEIVGLARENGDVETCSFAKSILKDELEHFDDIAVITGESRPFKSVIVARPL